MGKKKKHKGKGRQKSVFDAPDIATPEIFKENVDHAKSVFEKIRGWFGLGVGKGICSSKSPVYTIEPPLPPSPLTPSPLRGSVRRTPRHKKKAKLVLQPSKEQEDIEWNRTIDVMRRNFNAKKKKSKSKASLPPLPNIPLKPIREGQGKDYSIYNPPLHPKARAKDVEFRDEAERVLASKIKKKSKGNEMRRTLAPHITERGVLDIIQKLMGEQTQRNQYKKGNGPKTVREQATKKDLERIWNQPLSPDEWHSAQLVFQMKGLDNKSSQLKEAGKNSFWSQVTQVQMDKRPKRVKQVLYDDNPLINEKAILDIIHSYDKDR